MIIVYFYFLGRGKQRRGSLWNLVTAGGSVPPCCMASIYRLDTIMHTFISFEGEKHDHTYPWCWVTQPTEGRDGGLVSICSSEMKTRVSWEHWQTSDVLVCCVTRNGSLSGTGQILPMTLPHLVTELWAGRIPRTGLLDSEERGEGNAWLQNLGVFLTVSRSEAVTFSFYKCVTRKEWTIK